ncbi:vacuolar segregation subunit 7-domain-containing protein [Truncatella angustata]|uniref:Vacuolar segregation subunit 7-domain-containing protein n=1 Tax=Truncatella angustata TaxID=152316 RepID=A0A9P9A021_9PEZI|nr:vacuolar segregation subunit 7-domain-containing protein [Truncatella angustata]KAH6655584.1 vacuolar segregation subunit 7-domain-containing protein [Truncatella angustata]KAH8195068.1 hypothetical protein TruAng_010777 [Truncatella angustata]
MERSGTLPHQSSSGLDASISSLNSVDQETSATSSANIDTQPSRWTSTTTSLVASPFASREPSPTRTSYPKTGRTSRSSTTRSRKNSNTSVQDPSPSRSRSHLPPTSAPRQQISATNTPTLPPPSGKEPGQRAPQPQKPSVAAERSRDTPKWPVSPRLKSPPPALNRPAIPLSSGKSEREPPLINVQRATPSPHPLPSEPSSQAPSDTEGDDAANLEPGVRTPVRGPSGGSSQLETVQEVSQPNTPGPDLDMAVEKLSQASMAEGQGRMFRPDDAVNKTLKNQSGSNSESGSDSGSVKISTRRSSAAAPSPLLHTRQSSSALRFGGKAPPSDMSKHIMVEEEEVSSGPRLALGLNSAIQAVNGSLKAKPSTETIRPRKDKKKPTRKAASVASGTGETPTLLAARPTSAQLRHQRSIRSMSSSIPCRSPKQPKHGQGPNVEEPMYLRSPSRKGSRTPSLTAHVTNLLIGGPRPASSKADIFEAKVASAVEENNSSDSDETFVYDSNPPDAPDRPRRYHSRTPSATSMVSQADRGGLRPIHTMLDSGPVNPAIKKSMKFVNTYNSSGADTLTGDDDGKGTGGRSNAGSARGTGRHHHHGNRWGRNGSSTHLSLFDNESPFPNAARSKLSTNQPRHPSNPPSPRFAHGRGGLQNSKRQMAMVGGYDLDDSATAGADDERTPLLQLNGNQSVRSNRSRRTMVRSHSDIEAGRYRSRPSFLNRFASCLVLTIMLLLVIMGAVGFMFATSQPLTDIELVSIGNVLASEQELMMDIVVKAHNPNIVVVSVDAADLEVFAKSPHAGTDSEWWRHPQDVEILDDPPSDPPGDFPEDGKSPNMRLGNIMELDSPLSFEGSFFQSGNSMSSSELRLVRPGNGTDGGSERWERILEDEFTLILKGVLKYTLPLSQKVKSVSISGKATVKPNSASDPVLRKPNGTDFEVGIL